VLQAKWDQLSLVSHMQCKWEHRATQGYRTGKYLSGRCVALPISLPVALPLAALHLPCLRMSIGQYAAH
jgi:hypothetical protein